MKKNLASIFSPVSLPPLTSNFNKVLGANIDEFVTKLSSFNEKLEASADKLRAVEREVNVEKKGLDDFRSKVGPPCVT